MKNNKGFSLVELIIVIAIMAILVGVMAPQLIKYIEKSKISSDTQLCDTCRTAITTALSDPVVVNAGETYAPSGNMETLCGTGTALKAALTDIIGTASPSSQLKSTTAKGKSIQYTIQNGSQITVYVSAQYNGSNAQIGAGPATNLYM